MNLLSHTPPSLPVGSLEPPHMKRARSGSISSRLRSAKELCEEGMIDKDTQGVLKDMIIRDDPKLQHAMRRLEEGDRDVLKDLIADGTLAAARKDSVDLMGEYGDLNFDYLNVDEVGSTGSQSQKDPNEFLDADQFEFSFHDDPSPSMVGNMPGTQKGNTAGVGGTRTVTGATRKGSFSSRGGAISGSGSMGGGLNIKSEPINVDPKRRTVTRDARSGSFGANPLPDLFDFNLFDDGLAPGVTAGASPMSHSPSRSLGSLPGSHTSNSLLNQRDAHRPLHRDSIAQLDDILASLPDAGGSLDNVLIGSDNATSAPIGIPLTGRARMGSFGLVNGGATNGSIRQDSTRMKTRGKTRNAAGARPPIPPSSGVTAGTRGQTQNRPGRPPLNKTSGRQGRPPAGAAGTGVGLPAQRTTNRRASQPIPVQQGTGTSYRANYDSSNPTSMKMEPHDMASATGGPGGDANDDRAARNNFYATLDAANTNTNGYIGGYSPQSRRRRIELFLQKRQHRIWKKRVKYDVRKNFADSRLRVKGRFVKKEDEELLREFIVMTL